MKVIKTLDKIVVQKEQKQNNPPKNPTSPPRVERDTPMPVPKRQYIPIMNKNIEDDMPIISISMITETVANSHPKRITQIQEYNKPHTPNI